MEWGEALPEVRTQRVLTAMPVYVQWRSEWSAEASPLEIIVNPSISISSHGPICSASIAYFWRIFCLPSKLSDIILVVIRYCRSDQKQPVDVRLRVLDIEGILNLVAEVFCRPFLRIVADVSGRTVQPRFHLGSLFR